MVKCPEVSMGSFPLGNCLLEKCTDFRMLTPRSLMYRTYVHAILRVYAVGTTLG